MVFISTFDFLLWSRQTEDMKTFRVSVFLFLTSLLIFTSFNIIQRAEGTTKLPISLQSASTSNLQGVNLLDPVLIQTSVGPPYYLGYPPPVNSSLQLIKSYGFNFIRIPYYWESYQADPDKFLREVDLIASMAEKLGLYVDWDFHHLKASSYFYFYNSSSFGGFPYFFLSKYPFNGGESAEKKFWEDFFDRNITHKGKDIWQLQAEFMIKIVRTVDKYSSTLGYEILNQPTVFDKSQYAKIGKYNTFIAQQLRNHTSKYIFFDFACNSDCSDIEFSNQSLLKPISVDNVIFAPHRFGKPYTDMFTFLENLSSSWGGIPIVLGEWARTDQAEIMKYVCELHAAGIGWSFWSWNYQEHGDVGVPLNDINYSPTQYLPYLVSVMKLTDANGMNCS
jgi:aryl-phospho-beta-D-glucosidase BglC (GH1 family)